MMYVCKKSDLIQLMLQMADGSMMSSDSESAEELNIFFKSTFTLEEHDNFPTIPNKISDTYVY